MVRKGGNVAVLLMVVSSIMRIRMLGATTKTTPIMVADIASG